MKCLYSIWEELEESVPSTKDTSGRHLRRLLKCKRPPAQPERLLNAEPMPKPRKPGMPGKGNGRAELAL